MNVCFVTPRFPYPTTKGDKLRAFHAIRELSARHAITLVSASDEPLTAADIAHVSQYCARVEIVPISRLQSLTNLALYGAFTKLPLQTVFYRSKAFRERLASVLAETKIDVVHASLIRVLPYLWDLKTPPVVVDLMDSIALGTEIRIPTASPLMRPAYKIEAGRLRAYEAAACAHFPELFVCAERDRDALGAPNVSVVRTCADLSAFAYAGDGGRVDDLVVMTGNMGYQPNIDAVTWFAREVWPAVRAARPLTRFRIVGVRPAPAIRALDGNDGITVTGPVDDIAAELHGATVAISPMRGGAGLQTKVLEAMASGTPIVSTSFGNSGIGATPGHEIAIGDEPASFAAQLLRLLGDAVARRTQAVAARARSERDFNWAASARDVEAAYARAIAKAGAVV